MRYLALILVAVNTMYAQWSTDPAVNIPLSDTISNGSAQNPKAVSDGSGGAIIVWSRTRIYGQHVTSSGDTLWGKFGREVGTIGHPTILSYLVYPVIVSDDSGGAIIAWAEYNSGQVIGASRVRSDGSIAWQRRVCFTSGRRTNPDICSDGAGGAIITWEDQRNGTTNTDVFAQRISANGTVMWDSNGVAVCTAVREQTIPKIASDSIGGAFITWADNRVLDSDIYAQRINALGELQWIQNGIPVCAVSSNPAGTPKIAATATGQAIITWADGRSGGTWDIYAQGVNLDTTMWTINGVSICSTIRSQWKPEIVAAGSGSAIISWQDSRRVSFNEWDVYVQKVSSNGAGEWGLNGIAVCTQAGNPSVINSIASNGDGGAIIIWQDDRGASTDLYAQKIDNGGAPRWTFNGIAVCTAPYSQGAPTVVSAANGGAIFAWHDNRRITFLDIFGQGVDSTGALGTLTDVQERTAPMTFVLEQNYPNPFNPTTQIRFEVLGSALVTLKVFNLLGQEVATIVNEEMNPGNHSVSWDAANIPSGVYFYRLQAGKYTNMKRMLLVR